MWLGTSAGTGAVEVVRWLKWMTVGDSGGDMDVTTSTPKGGDRPNPVWLLLAGLVLLAGCGGAPARTVTGAPTPTASTLATFSPATTAAPVGTTTTATSPPVTSHPAATAPAPTTRPPFTTTTITAPGGHTTTVTEADSGRTITLHRGDQLIVELSGPSLYTWDEPASSNDAVLHRTTGSRGAAATATFLAAAPGQARVAATANPNCYPACLPPSRLFQISVSVT